jgi:hypothetical protein
LRSFTLVHTCSCPCPASHLRPLVWLSFIFARARFAPVCVCFALVRPPSAPFRANSCVLVRACFALAWPRSRLFWARPAFVRTHSCVSRSFALVLRPFGLVRVSFGLVWLLPHLFVCFVIVRACLVLVCARLHLVGLICLHQIHS